MTARREMSEDVEKIAQGIVSNAYERFDLDNAADRKALTNTILAALRSHGEARERVGAEAMRERIVNVLRAEHLDTLQAIYALALSAPETARDGGIDGFKLRETRCCRKGAARS